MNFVEKIKKLYAPLPVLPLSSIITVCCINVMLFSCTSENAVTTEPVTDVICESTQQEKERIVSFSFVSSLESLPYDAESALKSGGPIGGSPRYYTFEEGLTFYRQEWFYNTVTEFSLSLPEGYTDGNILFIGSGAGSGEVHIMLEAVYEGEKRYIVCDFFSDFLLEQDNDLVFIGESFITAEDAEIYLSF